MLKPTKLSVAKVEYIDWRRSQGHPYNTISSDAACLNRLVRVAGDIVVSSLKESHVVAYFLEMEEEGLGQRTKDLRLTQLRKFFEWCQHSNYMRQSVDLLFGRKARSHASTEDDANVQPRIWVPASEFPRLLDCADHPRDRIAVATALYTLLRGVDMVPLTVDQPNLTTGELTYWNTKGKRWATIPIAAEYDVELRRYLEWLHARHGQPRDGETWYLIPQFADRDHATSGQWTTTDRQNYELRPTVPLTTKGLRAITQAALARFGVMEKGEGNHTCRRSGGRAFYDGLVAQGVPGAEAERLVQVALDHVYLRTTLNYIGLNRRHEALNDQLRGKVMYPQAQRPDNVIDIRQARRK